jgi:hypothetical protein
MHTPQFFQLLLGIVRSNFPTAMCTVKSVNTDFRSAEMAIDLFFLAIFHTAREKISALWTSIRPPEPGCGASCADRNGTAIDRLAEIQIHQRHIRQSVLIFRAEKVWELLCDPIRCSLCRLRCREHED